MLKATSEDHPTQDRPGDRAVQADRILEDLDVLRRRLARGQRTVMGARSHATWLGSMVFDGARTFEGVTPDLDLHCARVNRSAEVFSLEADGAGRRLGRARARRHQALRPQCRALHPADVLGGERLARRRAPRSGIDALVPVHLRGGNAEADRRRAHALALPAADRTNARRSRPRPAASIPTMPARSIEAQERGFDNCLHARPARQCRRAWHRQRVHGEGRRRLYAGAQRHVPQRHHPPARHQAVARRRRRGGREGDELRRVPGTPTRFSPAAIIPRCRRSPASTIARCSRARSIARRASSTGHLPTRKRRIDSASHRHVDFSSSVPIFRRPCRTISRYRR